MPDEGFGDREIRCRGRSRRQSLERAGNAAKKLRVAATSKRLRSLDCLLCPGAEGLFACRRRWGRQRFGHVCTVLRPSLSGAGKRRQAKRPPRAKRPKGLLATLQLGQWRPYSPPPFRAKKTPGVRAGGPGR